MFGQRTLRREDDRLLTGRGLYVEDVQLPGMAYLGFVRSPYAHAIVRSIDAGAAREVPGVIAVITGNEWPELAGKLPELAGSVTNVTPYIDRIKIPPHHLFPDKARYVGEQIAVVVATSPYAAADVSTRSASTMSRYPWWRIGRMPCGRARRASTTDSRTWLRI